MHDWTDTAFLSTVTDEYLADITVKGGKRMDKSKWMSGYEKKLDQAQADVKDLVAFIRSLIP